MNYMEKVAKMLGVELYEDFDIKDNKDKIIFRKWRLTPFGLCKIADDGTISDYADDILVRLLTGYFKVFRSVLDDIEKEYLSGMIKPWRKSVAYIGKYDYLDKEFIRIGIANKSEMMAICLPSFKKGKMYKGMELRKEYTLEELKL